MSSVGFEAHLVSKDDETAAFCLSLPGKTLYLTPLLALKKFRKRGNKDGAVRAFYRLHEEGLGKVLEVTGSKGTSSVSRCCISKHFHVAQDVENNKFNYKDDYELVLACYKCTTVVYHRSHLTSLLSYSNLSLPRHLSLLLRRTKLTSQRS